MVVLTLEEKVRRGEGAKRLLEDELAMYTLDCMYTALHDSIDCQPHDHPDDVMAIVRQIRVIRNFRAKLESYVQEGDAAQREVERDLQREKENYDDRI